MRAGIGNQTGQAYAFMAMTPITPGEERPLEEYLHAFRDHGQESPLAKLPRTHMGRFVIVPDFHNDKTWKQRREEHLDLHYLIFTSNLDGDVETYLDELCEKLAPEAPQIWGRCVGCPENPKAQVLKNYLKHNQINTGIFFAAYQDATVPRVKHCLHQRERMIEFAVAAQGLAPAALQQAFLHEFGGDA
ncbi:MAG: hypothetical protein QOG42_607 [Solirubrobacteraceae bacterium]|jgi:hypothetical protein|nr:hypothetical protein [Solirubrobacteraceae bacterium]